MDRNAAVCFLFILISCTIDNQSDVGHDQFENNVF